VRVGELVGVALTAERSDGTTTVSFRGVFDLSVKGIDGGGNSAVAVGDKLYYTDADTPVLNKKTTGRFVGHALETVTSGATATIQVRLSN
jgi:predicted RecA/RadA family phage recombinase